MGFDLFGVGDLLRGKGSKREETLSEEEKLKKKIIQKKQKKLLSILISIPSVLFLLYFYGIGRSRYFVRSDIVIRKAGADVPSGVNIGNLLAGGNTGALEDSKFLRTYLESPQVLSDLKEKINFHEIYKKKGLDFYAGISKKISKEEEFDFFRRQISVTLNEGSGILRIRTLGFDPNSALFLNNFLIQKSESFVNSLNQEIYKKQLKFAEKEVLDNAAKLKLATNALSTFQQKNEVINPLEEVQAKSAFIIALEEELVRKKIDLSFKTKRFIDQNSPEIVDLVEQIKGIEDTIRKEKKLVLSPSGKDLSNKIAKYIELDFAKKYASDLYKTSLLASEKARIDSLQQQRFVAILSKPMTPDSEWKYWRHRGFLTSIAIFLVSFSFIKFLISMADSHRN